ncbi:MAG: hypothetical protein HY473_01990 [Candidatus Sungbacteria bacterium]|uniref:Uncharacterized protein n=1 Tax=Candidatus Sungiibacteriota bacterium TaxID=2750080 RepID=A0A933DS52_9BACT|nr:hypothetical protein [Candidatus Sungbacteria bacterium]
MNRRQYSEDAPSVTRADLYLYPWSIQWLFGSRWVEISPNTYNEILALLIASPGYRPAGVFTPNRLDRGEYRSLGQYTEAEWDAGAVKPDILTHMDGTDDDYDHRPGVTRTYCRFKRARNGYSVEIMKRGRTVGMIPRIVSFRHAGSIRDLPPVVRE